MKNDRVVETDWNRGKFGARDIRSGQFNIFDVGNFHGWRWDSDRINYIKTPIRWIGFSCPDRIRINQVGPENIPAGASILRKNSIRIQRGWQTNRIDKHYHETDNIALFQIVLQVKLRGDLSNINVTMSALLPTTHSN